MIEDTGLIGCGNFIELAEKLAKNEDFLTNIRLIAKTS